MSEPVKKLNSLKGSVFLHFILIALVGLITYSNTFDVPFQWDGRDLILNHGALRDLDNFIGPEMLKDRRYMGYLTFALNYKMHGLDVTGYHVFNIFIHILNALLCYGLVLLTFRTPFLRVSGLNTQSRYIALFTGLLFVSHPIQTQAVTYVVQRFASLATLFYLLSLVLYVRWRLGKDSSLTLRVQRRHLIYILAVISSVLAMKTKEIAFTLPLAITLYEYMFFRGALRKRFLYLFPLLLTMLIIPLGVLGVEKPLDEIIGGVEEATRVRDVSRSDYLLTQSRVIVTYLRLLVFPVNQNLDYDYPVYQSFFELTVFLSFLFLSGIFILGVYLLYHSRSTNHPARVIAFGIFWFFITLSVESSIIPLHVIYEHRLYLPSAGALPAFATGALLLTARLKYRTIKALSVLSLMFVPLVFSYATYSRNSVWQSESSLWEDVVRKSPHKERGHNNLGKVYFAEGSIDKALEHYQTAVRLNPDFAEAQFNLGHAYQMKGLTDKAIEHYQTAVRLNPDHALLHYNLGIAYKSRGSTEKAVKHYLFALRISPDSAHVHFNLGLIYFEKGHMDKARREFQTTLKINPDFQKAQRFLNHIPRE
jgi:tetratricopeptide (TPR) repeat protein